MIYLLDTCAVSEWVRPRPDAGYISWLGEQVENDIFLSVLTLGELEKGVHLLPKSRRKDVLRQWLDQDLQNRFEGRILPITDDIAVRWGKLQAETSKRGHVIPAVDALLAATALTHGMQLVTRNVRDFECSGVNTVNPWGFQRT